MSREIVFYGEKGILNSIVLDIQGDIAKQKQFIRSIILADKSKLSWVDSVHTVKCFMAPSLDQFGNPDMIMEAVTTDGEKYVLFIVTTTATYQNSALIMNQLEEKDNQYLPKTYINNSTHIFQIWRYIRKFTPFTFSIKIKRQIRQVHKIKGEYYIQVFSNNYPLYYIFYKLNAFLIVST